MHRRVPLANTLFRITFPRSHRKLEALNTPVTLSTRWPLTPPTLIHSRAPMSSSSSEPDRGGKANGNGAGATVCATHDSRQAKDVSIQLDEREKKLFDLLNKVSQCLSCAPNRLFHYTSRVCSFFPSQGSRRPALTSNRSLLSTHVQATQDLGMKTTMRVAGGWVRDKILGHSSHDIDIALDDQTGQTFASKINRYLSEHGEKVKPVTVVAVNPEQSKHLETAMLMLCGFSVDFVNLRAESYDDDTRIPNITFGTALEDAIRRDFTINTLFYNVATREIEDLTGKGLDDLRNGIIRTPMPTLATFKDDPLRMLRAVRFACRFGFELDAEICEALADESLARALSSKVSMERVGKELTGMIDGPQPLKAIEMLARFRLTSCVFQFPPSLKRTWQSDLDGRALRAAYVAEAVVLKGRAQRDAEQGDKDDAGDAGPLAEFCEFVGSDEADFNLGALLLSAALSPISAETYVLPKKTSALSLVKYVVSDGLHLELRLSAPLVRVLKRVPEWAELMAGNYGSADLDLDRIAVGLGIIADGKLWRASLLLGIIRDRVDGDSAASSGGVPQDDAMDKIVQDVQVTFDAVVKQVDAWGLSNLWQEKCKVNGGDVMRLMGLKRGIPYVGHVIEELTKAWILNPSASKQELEEWVRVYIKENPPPSEALQPYDAAKARKTKKRAAAEAQSSDADQANVAKKAKN
jgi:tRNA nucleotidyltransferase (CCA-adding enzyme)